MGKSTKILLTVVIFFSLILRLILVNSNLKNPDFAIQQDKYADYAVSLKKGTLNNSDKFPLSESRLFPGYPFLIFLVNPIIKSEIIAGLIISIVSSVLAIFLFWKITKNMLFTTIFAFFPPVWISQSTKIATEPITVLFLLLALFLYMRKKYLLSGLVLGLSFDIRLISICLLFSLLLNSLSLRLYKSAVLIFLGFFMFLFVLFFYNFYVFGFLGLFQQFQTYYSINNVNIGAIQIVKDIFRTIDWKQYRILFSGLFYLMVNFLAFVQLYRYKKISLIYQICFFWLAFSLLFILVLGPTPLLEEFSRFSVPFVPALILGISTVIGRKNFEKTK